MKGYRTMIVAAVQLFVGILAMTGVVITPEMQDTFINNMDAVIGGILVIGGIVQAVLRMKTDTKVGEKE
jgi:hypothetical protein